MTDSRWRLNLSGDDIGLRSAAVTQAGPAQFREERFESGWPSCGPVRGQLAARQEHHGGRAWGSRPWSGSREEKSQRRRMGDKTPTPGSHPVTLPLLGRTTPPTKPPN